MGYAQEVITKLGDDTSPPKVFYEVYKAMYHRHFPDGYGDGVAFWQRVYEVLSHGERALFLGMELQGELHNGGFDQYFTNGNYKHAHETVRVLRHVGAARVADFLQRAVEIAGIPDPMPPDYEYPNELLDDLDAVDPIAVELDKWEDRNRHPDRKERPFAGFEEIMVRYIHEHSAEFV